MKSQHDPMVLLESLRPRTSLPAVGSPPVLPPFDRRATSARVRSRRGAAVAAAVAVVMAGGAGAAAAAGLLPTSFTDAYSYWRDDDVKIDPSTAVALGSTSGPVGLDLVVYQATSAHSGWTCVAPVLQSPRRPARPAASAFVDGGSRCYKGEDSEAGKAFGEGVGVMVGNRQVVFVDSAAGEAAKATLTLPDGSRLSTVIAAGRVYGWLPGTLRADERAVLSAVTDEGTPLPAVDVSGLAG